MKVFRALVTAALTGLLLLILSQPAIVSAAPFAPTVLKVTVDKSFWQNYHLPSSGAGNEDIATVYRIKKAEVTLLAGDREFYSHTFTPQESKDQSFTIPHGLTNLKLRLKAYSADDTMWTALLDFKEVSGNRVVLYSAPGPFTLCSPGIK
ncbi:MAG TPA: hypothetical protein PKA10_19905 [Selenomonadales bacterium]|nr:hypothetical protein [Selenomonadales bacterium]